MNAAEDSEIESRIRLLSSGTESRLRILAEAKANLRHSERAWRQQAEQAVAAASHDAQKAVDRAHKGIEANAVEAWTSALNVVQDVLDHKAPDFLSADWSSRVWSALPPSAPGELMRVGSIAIRQEEIPIALPLSAGVWTVVCPEFDAFKTLVHNTIVRAVAAFDPPRTRVITYDAELALDLAVFSGVRPLSQDSVPAAISSVEAFEAALDRIVADIAAVDDRLTASGQTTYWSAVAGGHRLSETIPLRILVIGSSLRGLTERGAARLEQIRKLAADRGLLVMEALVDGEDRPRTGGEKGVLIRLDQSAATASVIPGVTWRLDARASDPFIRSLATRLIDRPRPSLAPSLAFSEIVGGVVDPWLDDADEGLEAAIGKGDVGDLVVRLRSENPPMPNALIGGAVGQGKSNLLLVLIHAIAVKYSPAEVEMILVDLRDGVEFARLGPRARSHTWLPHVRALGLEFDPDFCIAVLQWVRNEMSARSRMLRESSTTTLGEYRRATGKVIPRLLVVIDEFQRLFEGDDDQVTQAASLVEGIARTGRGFGVHLVLASQAVTGIRGLATKQDAIFGQFHNRITLRNTAVESQAFLAPHNLAATELEFRGQVVVNDSLGAIHHNRLGTVAFADREYLDQLQARLFAQGHRTEPPSVFRASAFAEWGSRSPARTRTVGLRMTVGLPIAVEAQPRELTVTRSPNQGVAVVGTDRHVAIPVLVRAVTTAAENFTGRPRICLLDADSAGSTPAPWVAALEDHLTRQGAQVERISREGIADRITALGRRGATADLVVAIALDSVDIGTPREPDYLIPNDSLRELLKNGPVNSTWTIGWWQSMSVLEEHLGYRAPGIRAWALCGVARDDLTSVCGHAVREPSEWPRFTWFDRTAGKEAERLVPFDSHDVIGASDLA